MSSLSNNANSPHCSTWLEKLHWYTHNKYTHLHTKRNRSWKASALQVIEGYTYLCGIRLYWSPRENVSLRQIHFHVLNLPMSSLFLTSRAMFRRAVATAHTTRSLSILSNSTRMGSPFSFRTAARMYTDHYRQRKRTKGSRKMIINISTEQKQMRFVSALHVMCHKVDCNVTLLFVVPFSVKNEQKMRTTEDCKNTWFTVYTLSEN